MDSAHAVLAGDLFTDYVSGHKSQTEIAAKCYVKREYADRMTRAEREVNMTRVAARAGELALDPVAVVVCPERFENGAVVLLTRWDEDLYTMDNMPWGRGLSPANVENAKTASRVLGSFNASGRMHGDAKIKNVASHAGTQSGMIDFETTALFDSMDPIQASDTAYEDFGKLTASLKKKGFFKPKQPKADDVRNVLHDMGMTYLEAWQDASPDVEGAVFNSITDIIDTRFAEITLPSYSLYV
jgi:hypothetical protein